MSLRRFIAFICRARSGLVFACLALTASLAAQTTVEPVYAMNFRSFFPVGTMTLNPIISGGQVVVFIGATRGITSPLYSPTSGFSFSHIALPLNVKLSVTSSNLITNVPGSDQLLLARSGGSSVSTALYAFARGDGYDAPRIVSATPAGGQVKGLAAEASGRFYMALSDGLIYQFPSFGAAPERIFGNDVRTLALGGEGLIYALDGNKILTKYRSDGTVAGSLALDLSQAPYLQYNSSSMAVDARGNIFVAVDRALQEFSPTGELVATFDSFANGDGKGTISVVLDEQGYLYYSNIDGDFQVYRIPGAVPEPATWAALAGVSVLGFAVWRRRTQAGKVSVG